MADTLEFTLPRDWDMVFGELQSGFNRQELLGHARLFVEFDQNGDHAIDSFELKRAQEKLDAKTHLQMREYLAAMEKSGREARISFRDFVQLQALIAGRELRWAKGRAGFIPPVTESHETVAVDQSHTGRAAFFEQLAAEKKAVVEREAKLKGPSAAEAKRKAKAEADARERARQEQEAAQAERRRKFAEAQRQKFEAGSQ